MEKRNLNDSYPMGMFSTMGFPRRNGSHFLMLWSYTRVMGRGPLALEWYDFNVRYTTGLVTYSTIFFNADGVNWWMSFLLWILLGVDF